MAAAKNAPYHDNCNFAQMIRTPVRMVYGTPDDNCQTIGGIAAFNRIASKDKQLRLLSGKGHGWLTAGFEDWLFSLPSPRKEESHDNRKSTQWKTVCGKSARTV